MRQFIECLRHYFPGDKLVSKHRYVYKSTSLIHTSSCVPRWQPFFIPPFKYVIIGAWLVHMAGLILSISSELSKFQMPLCPLFQDQSRSLNVLRLHIVTNSGSQYPSSVAMVNIYSSISISSSKDNLADMFPGHILTGCHSPLILRLELELPPTGVGYGLYTQSD